MAADENAFWRVHVKTKLGDYMHMKRIHRAQDGGIPDVAWAFKPTAFHAIHTPLEESGQTCTGFMELKVCRRVDQKLPIAADQLFWLQDWVRFAGRGCILLQDHRAAERGTPRFTFIRADSSYEWVKAMQQSEWRTHPSCTHMRSFDVRRILNLLSVVPRWSGDVYWSSIHKANTIEGGAHG